MSELMDRLQPGFVSPIWLLLGFLAVAALVLLEIGARRRRREAVRTFAGSHLVAQLTASVSPFKRILKRVLLITAIGLLFFAMARPYLFFTWREQTRTGTDILFAVDTSKSMLTEDVKPSRLERAKLAIADFADRVPDDRLGLIAFAGDAFLQCPLTLDRESFQTAVRELDTDTIPRPGTDIATAIMQAIEAMANQPNNAKILVLVTDGEDLEGRALQAARQAAQAGVKIYTVGVGTASGGPIVEHDDSGGITYHHDSNNEIVLSKLDENTLKQIASTTGGAYVALGQRGEGLDEIYSRYIATLPKQTFEEHREKVHTERFEWPLTLAILFLVWEFFVSERNRKAVSAPVAPAAPNRIRRRKKTQGVVAAPAALIVLAALALALPGRAASVDTAEKEYKAGNYQDSLQDYRKATETQPDRNELQYNRGTAAYKAGEYNEAEESFRKALNTPNLGLQQSAYYNLGNSQFRHGEALEKVDKDKTINLWEQALKSYDSSLKLQNSADARYNYEVVKRRLEQLKQQQQQDQKDQQKNQSNNQDQNQQNQNQNQKDSSGKNQQKNGGQGQDKNNPQSGNNPGNQPDKSPQNGKDPSQNQGSQGDQQGQQNKPGQNGKDANGQTGNGNPNEKGPVQAYSGTRSQDKTDPGAKSKQEAEDLLDSLKDDEKHVTARTLNGNNEPPPPYSGKDW